MSQNIQSYLFLALAIISEVGGSTLLQKSEQFTKVVPTILMAFCYLIAFYFLSLALKSIPLGVAYAIWGGLGIVLTATVGLFLFNQKLDIYAIIGIGFMITGIVFMQVFSKTSSH